MLNTLFSGKIPSVIGHTLLTHAKPAAIHIKLSKQCRRGLYMVGHETKQALQLVGLIPKLVGPHINFHQ